MSSHARAVRVEKERRRNPKGDARVRAERESAAFFDDVFDAPGNRDSQETCTRYRPLGSIGANVTFDGRIAERLRVELVELGVVHHGRVLRRRGQRGSEAKTVRTKRRDDATSRRLIDPATAKDVMSFCNPTWISDYTYRGLFDRIESLAP